MFYWVLVVFRSPSHVLLAVIYSSTLRGHILLAVGNVLKRCSYVFLPVVSSLINRHILLAVVCCEMHPSRVFFS